MIFFVRDEEIGVQRHGMTFELLMSIRVCFRIRSLL